MVVDMFYNGRKTMEFVCYTFRYFNVFFFIKIVQVSRSVRDRKEQSLYETESRNAKIVKQKQK